jgi:hypothetical protein
MRGFLEMDNRWFFMATIPERNKFYRLNETGTIVLIGPVNKNDIEIFDPVYERYVRMSKQGSSWKIRNAEIGRDEVRGEITRCSTRMAYTLGEMLRMQEDMAVALGVIQSSTQ